MLTHPTTLQKPHLKQPFKKCLLFPHKGWCHVGSLAELLKLQTYCNLEADWFVPDLPVNHGGLQERPEEEELLHFPCGALDGKRHKH